MHNNNDYFHIYNNIGKLLVSDEHVPPSFICEEPKKHINDYKDEYYNKLIKQLTKLETNKRELLHDCDKQIGIKKQLEEKISNLNNKISKNNMYIRSVGNIFNFYTDRLKDNLSDITIEYDDTNMALNNIKKHIEFLDDCIFTTNKYISLIKDT